MNKKIKQTIINIGTGIDFRIKDYVRIIGKIIVPKKKIKIKFDRSMPNGTPRKLLNTNLARSYGWRPKIKLNEAIYHTYIDFLKKNHVYK